MVAEIATSSPELFLPSCKCPSALVATMIAKFVADGTRSTNVNPTRVRQETTRRNRKIAVFSAQNTPTLRNIGVNNVGRYTDIPTNTISLNIKRR